ncbi:hypothetical protein R1flu_009508 [Riccia fluitans]|uniref:Cleavage and polyadenylation specificity factor subunit 1 n=1 Tax=Riccia fluitans TaxID=41844 RepID=A0ABD1Z2B5_9MARC
MSYAAFKMAHAPTGVENCASAFLTHCPVGTEGEELSQDVRSKYGMQRGLEEGPPVVSSLPNLVISKANVLEVYYIRCQEDHERINGDAAVPISAIGQPGRRGGTMDGISAAWLELVCHYRLHGNVESMAVLSHREDESRRRRDAIILTFRDAKISVLEFDDSTHNLRTSSLHYFEGPEWEYLKRGRERFARGPLVRADPIGRCAGMLVYNCQMVIMKAAQVGYCLGDEDDGVTPPGASVCAHIASSYVVSLRDLDMKHVKDFVFLNGYNEPVILALHEKEPTWAGRVAVKRHTCAITALSINTTLMQHTLIWSAVGLPYDAYKLIAVPSPIEGVLVLCGNTLHYYNQSSSCGLALNEFASAPEGATELPRSKLSVELDAAQVTWISHDVALFSTKNGNLLLLYLVYDGRTVQKLELSKSRASVLASCMCMVGRTFFFLGSRLGDSLLVQYSPSLSGSNGVDKSSKEEGDIEMEAPAAKRQRQSLSDSQDAADELLLYSPEKWDTPTRKTYSFAVRDSLVNVGPLRDFAQGLRMNADMSAKGIARQSNYELVTCSGHGKNGSVSVLHQSIRPDLITDVQLPGCSGVWTVYYTKEGQTVPVQDEEYHAYLIISLDVRTMILETGETLGEVTESVEYYTQGPTVLAGNLFGRRRVIQVYADGVRLLDGAAKTQEIPVLTRVSEVGSEEVKVASASIADPYILLKMSNGSAQLVTGDPDACSLDISSPSVLQNSAGLVTACTLFTDKAPGCWMRRTSDPAWSSKNADQAAVYCILCRENGNLEIHDLPGFTCVFRVKKFNYGKTILSNYILPSNNQDASGTTEPETLAEAESQLQEESKYFVTDICMETWGKKFGRPFLFAILSDGTMLCYHAYSYEDTEGNDLDAVTVNNEESIPSSKNLRFVRTPVDWVSGDEQEDEEGGKVQITPKLVRFSNVGNVQGLFVTGARPTWLMVCRERIRVHPQYCDGAILAFTPLHNVNCSHGLIYATSEGVLKICQLPSLLNFDNDWPLQKIPLKSTPHQVTYHADVGVYALIISSTVMLSASDLHSSHDHHRGGHHGGGGDHHQYDNGGGDESQSLLSAEEFEVRMIGPAKVGGLWETKGSLPMYQLEHALTVRIVTIKTTGTEQVQTLLAIGTAYAQGEDVPSKGRIILVSVGGDSTESNVSVKEVYSKEMKGCISAIASLQGNLLLAIGAKIILHTWNGSELNGAAFFDAPLFVVSLNIVKNFVLFGDIHKSIYFLNWKEEGAQLQLLAKDFSSLDCFTTEFLIDGSTLSLLVSDSRKNIQIFSYAPKSVESWRGQKLLPRAEFHLGAHVTKFLRLQMLPTATSNRSNRFAVLFGTLDGGIDFLAPLDELTFRRVQALQKKLVDVVPHVAGLNPRAFRQFQCEGTSHRPGPDNIVDCELLSHYTMLALDQQVEVARSIGTTRTQILSNLRDLSLSTSFL